MWHSSLSIRASHLVQFSCRFPLLTCSLPPTLPMQAATNTLLGHFLSLVCSLWLLNIVGEGRGLRFQV